MTVAELTPIPGTHRAVYYDALRAGRAEAERLGYPLLDDRIFGEFWAAIRSAYTPLIVADTRRKVAEEITDNVRNADFAKQDRGVWSGFTERMAYVAGHDKAAAIARGSGNGDSGQEAKATGGVITGRPYVVGEHGCVIDPFGEQSATEKRP
jgi:hypothetical protein